ncbi:fimbrial protein [Pseudomonas gessardii]|uniref:fimbrial protein n=2 Tax=Pseudomonas gessardii TaxID=78544 RepID=UPI0014749827|nr:fimbrial protein [Pseudomonas gessardii]NNA70794.1 type 1 fimbrial protein [Pseudomonas gessardii]
MHALSRQMQQTIFTMSFLMMDILKPATLTALLILSWNATAATCSFYPGHQQSSVKFTLPLTISLPRDAPNGTVLYESPPSTLQNVASSFKCTSESSKGVINSVGSTVPDAVTFPIGDTGIAWQWLRTDTDKLLKGFPGSIKQKVGGFGYNGTSHAIRLVKIGNISNSRIAPGILGRDAIGGTEPLAMEIIGAGTSVIPQSCETPDVQVDMGPHDISSFPTMGAYSKSVQFNIKANNCPTGMNKVTYSLKTTPGSPVRDVFNGTISLNQSSKAKGLALQILGENEEPVVFDQDYTAGNYSASGGSFTIPLAGRYIRILQTGSKGGFDPGMVPGTANAELWFIMSYL